MSLDPTGMTSAAKAVDESGAAPSTPEGKAIEGRSPWLLGWQRLRRDRVAMISLAVIVLIVLMAILAPLATMLTGHPPNEQYRQIGLTPDGLPEGPTGQFLLGTDDLGRDILVRIAYGARVSLLVGVVSTVIAVAIGVVIGLAAGFFGGIVDTVLARLVDVALTMPFLLVAIALVSITGPSLTITILVIGFFSWASVARIVRGQVLSLREREFVEAARSLGASDPRIMFRGHPAQRAGTSHRLHHLAHPRGDRDGGGADLPRAWSATADGGLGRHDQRWSAVLHDRVVVHHVPWYSAAPHHLGLQPVR